MPTTPPPAGRERGGGRAALGIAIALLALALVAVLVFVGAIFVQSGALSGSLSAAPGGAGTATGGGDAGGTHSTSGAPAPDDPFAGATLFADPGSKAATAAAGAAAAGDTADAALFGKIAAVPTAIWLTPEQHGVGDVGAYIGSVMAQAAAAGAMPVFTVYGIPNRDCGNQSSGGLSTADYPVWIQEIADALKGKKAAVILEPDALALATQCGDVDERVAEIGSAVGVLAASGAAVYIDAGHSNWGPAADMAALLNRAGVSRARGFATNVSNYNATAAEQRYADQISSLTGGAHYVIDTSRNGNGTTGDWCNPPGRALGATPAATPSGSAQDAGLWIKPPGESDGTCNGGPAAGDWWADGARQLATDAGW